MLITLEQVSPIDITLETVSGATIAELLNQALFILSQRRYDLVIFMGGGK